jgi:hypothetical protein
MRWKGLGARAHPKGGLGDGTTALVAKAWLGWLRELRRCMVAPLVLCTGEGNR